MPALAAALLAAAALACGRQPAAAARPLIDARHRPVVLTEGGKRDAGGPPAGRARVEGADVLAAGNVLVEVTHEVAGGETLAGSFVPPAEPRPGQRYELAVERPDGTPIRRFFWSPSFWDRFRGARPIELPLRDARDYVRVRLLSRGASADPPGRWRGLRLVPSSGRELSPGL